MKLKKKIILLNEIPKKRCKFCFDTEHLTYDHIIPKSLGGKDEPKNIQVLCEKCNNMKASITNSRIRSIARWVWEVNQKRESLGKKPFGIKKLE